MKLLFDQNLSFKLCLRLKDLFPNSQQVRLLGMSDSDDRDIWLHCGTNDFIVVTQDSDFADMAAVLGPPPKVVWLRCGNQPTATIEHLLREHFQTIEAFADDETAACLEIY
jgi:predicted nuclease of predicted toxin-antitoxin system